MWGADHYDFHEESDPLYKSIPFFLSLRERMAYGLLFDNTCRSYFDFGATDEKVLSFGSFGGLMNYYFIYDNTPLDIISAYTRLTGTPELPPLWALGYHQSKWSYYPDKAVYNLVERFRAWAFRAMPCIWTIITWNGRRDLPGTNRIFPTRKEWSAPWRRTV